MTQNNLNNCEHEFKIEMLYNRAIQVCQKCRHYILTYKKMTTANDYLASKLQETEYSLKYRNLEANYWQKKYFDLLRSQGKTLKDIEKEITQAIATGYSG